MVDMSVAGAPALKRQFYIGVSLLMALIAVTGFWATYFGPLVQGSIDQPLLIHVHAAVFTGWLVLFLVQSALAATGHVLWHLQLGRIGIWYGVLLVLVGLYTGVSRSADLVAAGAPGTGLLWAATADMAFFAVFFAAAVAYRRKHRIHKRLMIVAATALLIAAVARMPFLPPGNLRLLVWTSPILAAIAHDVYRERRVHPVYLLGLAGVMIRRNSTFLNQTESWADFTAWVTGWML